MMILNDDADNKDDYNDYDDHNGGDDDDVIDADYNHDADDDDNGDNNDNNSDDEDRNHNDMLCCVYSYRCFCLTILTFTTQHLVCSTFSLLLKMMIMLI